LAKHVNVFKNRFIVACNVAHLLCLWNLLRDISLLFNIHDVSESAVLFVFDSNQFNSRVEQVIF